MPKAAGIEKQKCGGNLPMQKTTGELLDLLKKSPTASTYMEQAADNLIHQIP
mgnify:CR=1 FL=1